MRRIVCVCVLAVAACSPKIHRNDAGQTKSWEVAAAATALQVKGVEGTCDKAKNADLKIVCNARTPAECKDISNPDVRAFCNYDCSLIKDDGYRALCGYQGHIKTCTGMEKYGEWFAICESGLPTTIHSDGCEAGYHRTSTTAACEPV